MSVVHVSCEKIKMDALDKLDRQILRSLQADGRATYEQIAEGVGLSPSAGSDPSGANQRPVLLPEIDESPERSRTGQCCNAAQSRHPSPSQTWQSAGQGKCRARIGRTLQTTTASGRRRIRPREAGPSQTGQTDASGRWAE